MPISRYHGGWFYCGHLRCLRGRGRVGVHPADNTAKDVTSTTYICPQHRRAYPHGDADNGYWIARGVFLDCQAPVVTPTPFPTWTPAATAGTPVPMFYLGTPQSGTFVTSATGARMPFFFTTIPDEWVGTVVEWSGPDWKRMACSEAPPQTTWECDNWLKAWADTSDHRTGSGYHCFTANYGGADGASICAQVAPGAVVGSSTTNRQHPAGSSVIVFPYANTAGTYTFTIWPIFYGGAYQPTAVPTITPTSTQSPTPTLTSTPLFGTATPDPDRCRAWEWKPAYAPVVGWVTIR
jgi:hypothetical protein